MTTLSDLLEDRDIEDAKKLLAMAQLLAGAQVLAEGQNIPGVSLALLTAAAAMQISEFPEPVFCAGVIGQDLKRLAHLFGGGTL